MARSTRKSLAGSAVSAARRAIRRAPAAKAENPAAGSSAKTARKPSGTDTAPAKNAARKTAKQAATTKASAKAAAKKAPAKKATTKRAATKAEPAKKTARQAAAKKTATKTAKAPAKKTATKTAKQAATKKATTKKAATKKTATPPAKQAAPQKVAAKKSATPGKVSALVVKEGESAWTRAEIKEVLAELTEHREKVAATLAAQEEELALLMRDAGDGAGQDQADMGATSFERDHELTVVNNEREKLAQIDRALARIENGTYGVCESCGNPIGKMRVMAFPRATLCLTCKQREERR
jgi:RNA polymerase-binding protein DksA